MGRVCEHCGSDTYRSEYYDQLLGQKNRVVKQNERLARENGLLRAQLDMAVLEAGERRAELQRKISKQAKAIRRLEDRWREKFTTGPHEGVTPSETSPVARGN